LGRNFKLPHGMWRRRFPQKTITGSARRFNKHNHAETINRPLKESDECFGDAISEQYQKCSRFWGIYFKVDVDATSGMELDYCEATGVCFRQLNIWKLNELNILVLENGTCTSVVPIDLKD
jgi:hypothetical protein